MNTRRYSLFFASLVTCLILLSSFISSQKGAVEAGEIVPFSDTVSLPAVADVSLAAEFPDYNFQDPDFPFLELDYWHDSKGVLTYVRIFLIRFDLTGLPPDAIIDNASMQLHWNGCSRPGTYPVSVGVYFVNSPWTESTVTYNTRPSWATVGLSNQFNCPPDNDPTIWNITSFAQAWQSDPVHNYGVKVSAPWAEGYDYSITFDSREYPNVTLLPELVVTYHLPSTYTPTSTITRTSTPTRTPTPTNTRTPTTTSTSTPTRTPTPTSTSTPTRTPSPTSTNMLTPIHTATPTRTSTLTPIHTATPTPTTTTPPGCSDLLVNGDFETGSLSPWGKDGLAGVSQPGRYSVFHAWLGGQDNTEAEVFQWVDVPSNISAAPFIFWWQADVGSEQPDDILSVLVQYDSQADIVYTLQAGAPLDQWRRAEVDLSAYAGMHVLITFHSHTDGAIPTTFRVDDAALLVCGVPLHSIYMPLILRDG